MRTTVLKFFAATLAAASLTAFAAPTYAATAEESSAQQSAWCDVVPPFCSCNIGVNARCRCVPLVVQPKGLKARDLAACPKPVTNKE
jgi:hypothetical protein